MPTKQRSFRVEAIVLSHTNWGEADRLISLYTRELGKVRTVAKGVRKPRSRKAGHLEPFTRASFQLAKGRDLYILTQVEALDPHINIKNDLVLLGYGAYVIELLSSFTYEEGENRDLYRLLVNSLTRLNQGDDPNLVVRYYEIRLLDLVGFRPQLFDCVVCDEEILPQDQWFSATLGGIVCPKCNRRVPNLRPLSLNGLRYLRHFQRSSYRDAQRAQIEPEIWKEIETLMHHYLTHVLERGLNTPAFLNRMKHERSLSEGE
jgi:DNA repair protein RecO (recombination protein O)